MFVPLHDTNPLKRIDFQYVTVGLILLNVAIFVIFQTGWVVPLDDENTAAWALGIWILAQFGSLLVETEENVAWWAHIGGLAAGATLILFMRRRGVILFDKTRGGA